MWAGLAPVLGWRVGVAGRSQLARPLTWLPPRPQVHFGVPPLHCCAPPAAWAERAAANEELDAGGDGDPGVPQFRLFERRADWYRERLSQPVYPGCKLTLQSMIYVELNEKV